MKKANEKIDDITYYDAYGRRRMIARGDYADPVTAEITLRGQMVVHAKSEKQAKYATDVLFRWVQNFHRNYVKTCGVDPAIFAYRVNSLLDYFCDNADAKEILDGVFTDLMRNHKQDVMRIMQWDDETEA